MNIRLASQQDAESIWTIIEPVLRAGESYVLNPNMNKHEFLEYWFEKDKTIFVAEEDSQIFGTYYLKANQSGGGSHICNCGYITAHFANGRGLARKMCEHSIIYAKTKGYSGIQFSFVVSNNAPAIGLWLSIGFEIVGKISNVFKQPNKGKVDALLMYRDL